MIYNIHRQCVGFISQRITYIDLSIYILKLDGIILGIMIQFEKYL